MPGQTCEAAQSIKEWELSHNKYARHARQFKASKKKLSHNACLIACARHARQSDVSIFPDWCRYSKLDLKPAERPTVHYGAHRDVSMQSQNKHKLLNLLIMFATLF